MEDQILLRFFEVSFTHSRFGVTSDSLISTLAKRREAQQARWSESSLELFQHQSNLRVCFLASIALGKSHLLPYPGPEQ